MPIYEFRCDDCSTLFETIVFSSSPRVVCPACGSEHVERQPSTFGIAGERRTATSGAACSGCRRSSCAGCR